MEAVSITGAAKRPGLAFWQLRGDQVSPRVGIAPPLIKTRRIESWRVFFGRIPSFASFATFRTSAPILTLAHAHPVAKAGRKLGNGPGPAALPCTKKTGTWWNPRGGLIRGLVQFAAFW